MNVLTIVFILVLTPGTTAQTSIEYSVNVGTVLFTPTDLNKKEWNMEELSLLRARRHFQELLPPPNFIDTRDRSYVNALLSYFKKIYSSIKREATSPVADGLMTTAFSDALGGYMKLWVMPISKLAFYSGYVPQGDIITLQTFYGEIKKFMQTDGSGWRKPDKKIMHSIAVNISPPPHVTRRMKNACEDFAYYENTSTGLVIPTPHIDWGHASKIMFLPLRNQSLIPLESTEHPNALIKYYDTAKNCINADQSSDSREFDARFQSWLNSDVVPHLSDICIYYPLGNVLSLVNPAYEKSMLYPDNINTNNLLRTYVIAGIPIDFSSKKALIIFVILILEIAWCIPALIYLLCPRRKKRNSLKGHLSKNVNSFLDACKNVKRKVTDKVCVPTQSKLRQATQGFKIATRPRTENLELETQFIPPNNRGSTGTDTHSYFGSEACSRVSVVHETKPAPPLKSSMKKIRSIPQQQTIIVEPPRTLKSRRSSISRNKLEQKLSIRTDSYTIDTTNPSTVYSSVKEIITIPVENKSSTVKSKSSSDSCKKSESECGMYPCNKKGSSNCPCMTCLEAEVGSETTVINVDSQLPPVCSDKSAEINLQPVCPLIEQERYARKMKTIGLRLETGRPYLEIKIDKPQTEISLGIDANFQPSKSKRSKIPKRTHLTTAAIMSTATSPVLTLMPKEPISNKKSFIPQPKKRPVDDIVIKSSQTKQKRKDDKLNVTL